MRTFLLAAVAALTSVPALAQYTGPVVGIPAPFPSTQGTMGPLHQPVTPLYPRERFDGSIGNAQSVYGPRPQRQRQCMTNCSYNRCFTSCF